MLESIDNQAYIFLCIVIGGMLIGFVYDLFRVSRKAIKTKNIIVHLEDILFWLLVSILIFGILFVCNAGEIRGYAIIAIILGVIIYVFMFSPYVIKILLKIINVAKSVLKIFYKALKGPIKFIIRLLYIPIKYITNVLRKIWRYTRKVKNAIMHRIRLNIKNIITSIKKF